MKKILKNIANAIGIILIGTILCASLLAVDFYKRECGSLESELRAARARIMNLAAQKQDLETELEEKTERLTYIEQQYEPYIEILKGVR